MTVIEELMATVRAQQHTIEVLTIKLEETNAKLDKANARIAELKSLTSTAAKAEFTAFDALHSLFQGQLAWRTE